MPRTHLPEWLLARAAGRTRAAAIYGDLLELAQTRGRLWFFAVYVRTLFTLTWRTPVAFVAAIAGLKFIYPAIVHGLGSLMHQHRGRQLVWHGGHSLFGAHVRISEILFRFAVAMAFSLFFALPYVALRFGLRNRLSYLAGVLFLITIPIYTRLPWVRELSGMLALLAILIALALPLWRKPLVVLAATCAVPIASVAFCRLALDSIFHRNPFSLTSFGVSLAEVSAIAIAAIVCPTLYRWLLEPQAPPSQTPSTGAAHA